MFADINQKTKYFPGRKRHFLVMSQILTLALIDRIIGFSPNLKNQLAFLKIWKDNECGQA